MFDPAVWALLPWFLSSWFLLQWLKSRQREKRQQRTIRAMINTTAQMVSMAMTFSPYRFVLEEIQRLMKVDAMHRKGKRLSEITDEMILNGASEELQELKDAPRDIHEWADTMLCLMHYQIRMGWDESTMEAAMRHKLKTRFTEPEKEAAADEQQG